MFKRLSLMAMVLALGPTLAFAGPQYVDQTGFAVSGHDVVAYFDLPQAEVGQAHPPPPCRGAVIAPLNTMAPALPLPASKTTTVFLPIRPDMPRNTMGIAPMGCPRAARCRATRTCGGSSMAGSM